MVLWVGLQCVIVVFPDHTLLLSNIVASSLSLEFSSFVESKKGVKDQESIQSSTTPDPGYRMESDKNTVKPHKREPRGQPFPSR